jgi:hypothetical protein
MRRPVEGPPCVWETVGAPPPSPPIFDMLGVAATTDEDGGSGREE